MNRRNFLKNLGSATYEATKAQVPTTPKIIQKVREIDDFATKAKKYDNFAENINSGLEKSISRRQFLKNAAKPAARAAINTLESGAKGAAYLSEGSLIPNQQIMKPISSLADKFREAVRYIKFQKGKNMKHFTNFSLLNKYTAAGTLLGAIAGYNIANKKPPANHYDEADALDREYDDYYNSEPEDVVNKRWLNDQRVAADQKKRKDWEESTNKRLVVGSLTGGLAGGLLATKLGNYKPKANFGIGSTIGLGLAGGLLGNAFGNSIGRRPEIDNQYKTLKDNYYARLKEIYPQAESIDEPDPTDEEMARRHSAHDELTKDYLSKVTPLNEKYKDYKQGVENRSNLGFYAGAGLGLLAANHKALGNPIKAYKNWQWQQNRKNSMPIR